MAKLKPGPMGVKRIESERDVARFLKIGRLYLIKLGKDCISDSFCVRLRERRIGSSPSPGAQAIRPAETL